QCCCWPPNCVGMEIEGHRLRSDRKEVVIDCFWQKAVARQELARLDNARARIGVCHWAIGEGEPLRSHGLFHHFCGNASTASEQIDRLGRVGVDPAETFFENGIEALYDARILVDQLPADANAKIREAASCKFLINLAGIEYDTQIGPLLHSG